MKPAIVYPMVALEFVPTSTCSADDSDIDLDPPEAIPHGVIVVLPDVLIPSSSPMVIPVPFEDLVQTPHKRVIFRGRLVSLINIPIPLPSSESVPLFSAETVGSVGSCADDTPQHEHTRALDVDKLVRALSMLLRNVTSTSI